MRQSPPSTSASDSGLIAALEDPVMCQAAEARFSGFAGLLPLPVFLEGGDGLAQHRVVFAEAALAGQSDQLLQRNSNIEFRRFI